MKRPYPSVSSSTAGDGRAAHLPHRAGKRKPEYGTAVGGLPRQQNEADAAGKSAWPETLARHRAQSCRNTDCRRRTRRARNPRARTRPSFKCTSSRWSTEATVKPVQCRPRTGRSRRDWRCDIGDPARSAAPGASQRRRGGEEDASQTWRRREARRARAVAGTRHPLHGKANRATAQPKPVPVAQQDRAAVS